MKVLIVIPHYNHSATLRRVAEGCLALCPHVAVFDDGSTVSPEKELAGLKVSFIRFAQNRGKGVVIQEAAKWAHAHGYTHLVTIDADGQHHPNDFPLLLAAAKQNPLALVIGKRKFDKKTVPFSSRFGRAFGGFWVHLQTGKPIGDIQSGYRCYPADLLLCQRYWCKRYAFEVEVTVRALWAGFPVEEVDISVTYPKNRISHFSGLKDNLRLTVLNTYLTIRSMLPVPHRQYCRVSQPKKPVKKRGYWEVMIENLKHPDSAVKNAFSAAWGIFCGSIAFPGVRQVMLFMGAGWWNLNRVLTISFEKLCIGPSVPALCIEAGYFIRYGRFLTEFNLTTLGHQFLQRVWEWVIGSFVVAPLLAALTFGLVWVIGKLLTRGLNGKQYEK